MSCNISLLLQKDCSEFLCTKSGIEFKNLPVKNIKVPTEQTNLESFDLIDKKETSVQGKGTGCVTYKNEKRYKLFIINYENYINSLPKRAQQGIKRCDFLIYSENKKFFFANELSTSRIDFSKEAHAIKQLSQTIKTMFNCKELENEIKTYKEKICIFSNRTQNIKTPRGMADSFLTTPFMQNKLNLVQIEDIPEITELGFKYCKSSYIVLSDNFEFYKDIG